MFDEIKILADQLTGGEFDLTKYKQVVTARALLQKLKVATQAARKKITADFKATKKSKE